MSGELEAKFRQAKESGRGYIRVSAEHPVDLFVGVDEGRRSVLLLCESEPRALPLIDAVEVKKRARDDKRWALLVALRRPELGGLFAYLCTDLVEATLPATSGDAAATTLIERLRWWQRLLSKGRSSLLGDMALRGLVSELLFLVDHAIPFLGADAATTGWVGPFDAPRDFKFDNADVEVKSIARDGSEITITSLEQLDQHRAGVPLFLAVTALERVLQAQQGAFSCAELVQRVRALCEPEEEAIHRLNERLWLAGYSDAEEYSEIWFVAAPFTFYLCGEGFPKILRNDVQPGVVACSYELNLRAIEHYSIPTWSALP